VGFVQQLAQTLGDDGEITLDEFMQHGLRTATSYATTVAGTAAQIADYLEERFEGSGSRGGFMLRHSQAEQIEMLHNIVDLLVPELQRRGPLPDVVFRSHAARQLGHMRLRMIAQACRKRDVSPPSCPALCRASTPCFLATV